MRPGLPVTLVVIGLCVAIASCGGVALWLLETDGSRPSVGLLTREPSLPGLPDVQCSALLRGDLELRMCGHRSPEGPSCQCTLEVWNLGDEVRRFKGYPPDREPFWRAFDVPPKEGVVLTGNECQDGPFRDVRGLQCRYRHDQKYSVAVLMPANPPAPER